MQLQLLNGPCTVNFKMKYTAFLFLLLATFANAQPWVDYKAPCVERLEWDFIQGYQSGQYITINGDKTIFFDPDNMSYTIFPTLKTVEIGASDQTVISSGNQLTISGNDVTINNSGRLYMPNLPIISGNTEMLTVNAGGEVSKSAIPSAYKARYYQPESTTVSNTNTETNVLIHSLTTDLNDVIRADAAILVTNSTAASFTMTMRLYFGATVIATTTATITVGANRRMDLKDFIATNTAAASKKYIGMGDVIGNVGTTNLIKTTTADPTTFRVTLQMSVANANASWQRQYSNLTIQE